MFLLAFSAVAGGAQAEDLSTREPAWNGLSELRALADQTGVAVITPERFDVEQLGPEDALLVVHPVEALPSAELSAFLRSGGRLAVADDFGSGKALLAAFGIGVYPPNPNADTRYLRGQRHLMIASRQSSHPLSRSAAQIVTNRPQVLTHRQLDPIYALRNRNDAIVLTGAVGKGRLVAISDASVLINNMLQFDANRAFARDLLAYLVGSGRGRLFLLGSDTQWKFGMHRFGAEHPLESVRAVLSHVARLRLPASAVSALSAVLALLLLVSVVTALPRRAIYARRKYLEVPQCPAGFAGQVNYYKTEGRNFLPPLLAFKFELESRIIADLGLRGQLSLADVLAALRARGVSERSLNDTRELLVALDTTQSRTHGATPQIPARKFSALVATGQRILTELDGTSGLSP
ncbi:MAG TPA: DUF4350 domain-containing protein [Polyangiales bacterium]|nr:DUF4350 domain-containing protein [Polyangiales bacterium]